MYQENFSSELYYYNINKLANLYKENNELIADIITSNTFTSENHMFTEDYLKNVIDQIISLNRSIYDNLINIMNNLNTGNYQGNQNTYSNRTRTNVRSSYNRSRQRDARININGLPYIIDSIERYSAYSPISQRSNNLNQNYLQSFFEPIEIYPTQEQIENATRIVRYSDILRPLNTSCPISLERFNDDDYVTVIRSCLHIFNTNELNNWFRSNCRCPVCRYDIRNYNSENNLNELINTDLSNNYINNNDNTNTNTNTNANNETNTNANTNTNTNNVNTSRVNNSIERITNSTRLLQQLTDIINDLDSDANTNTNTIRRVFYSLTDLSGNNLLNNDTLDTINYLWNNYRST
jgi:hypothetical protein